MRSFQDLLDLSPWWPMLDAAQQSRVLTSARVVDVAADAQVCARGDPVVSWLGVIDGLVNLCNRDERGRTATLAGVPRGGWFGEGSLLKDEARRFEAVALRDSRIAHVPRDTFLWLLDTSIPFNRFVIGQLNERLGHFIGALESQRMLSPEGRLARCIGQLFNAFLYPGVDARLSYTQHELGALTGLSRQRVNRALKALEAQGLIQVNYGCVTVVSVEALRDYADSSLRSAGLHGSGITAG